MDGTTYMAAEVGWGFMVGSGGFPFVGVAVGWHGKVGGSDGVAVGWRGKFGKNGTVYDGVLVVG